MYVLLIYLYNVQPNRYLAVSCNVPKLIVSPVGAHHTTYFLGPGNMKSKSAQLARQYFNILRRWCVRRYVRVCTSTSTYKRTDWVYTY